MHKNVDWSVVPAAHHNIGESLYFFGIFSLKLMFKIGEKPFEELDEELIRKFSFEKLSIHGLISGKVSKYHQRYF